MAATVPFEVASDGASLRGTLHLPDDHISGAQPAVLICRGIPTQSSESGAFFEALTASLTDAGFVVALYEHRCASLILDDYHEFSPANDVADLTYITRWLAANDHVDRDRLTILGFALGSVPVSMLVSSTDHPPARMVLLNPFTVEAIRSLAGMQSDSAKQTEDLPKALLNSLDRISPPRDAAGLTRPTLILQSAADTVLPATSAEEFVTAFKVAGQSPDFIYVARADHRLTNPSVQETCIACILDFLAPLLQPVLQT
ncbi:MAG TPA: prolyl oligopeptidase family serine peptidase [Phycisphaerales bacterium]|nr:prolyl oligopeptidase family serine peptidase [Phycisphaerales bacterium]